MSAVLRSWPHEVEADLVRFYGRRVADWWRWVCHAEGDVMTSRELFVLIEQLPEDSATQSGMRADPWTSRDHLIADVFDTLTFLRADYSTVNGAERTPEPMLRPTQRAARLSEADVARAAQQSLHDLIHGRVTLEVTSTGPRDPEVETF